MHMGTRLLFEVKSEEISELNPEAPGLSFQCFAMTAGQQPPVLTILSGGTECFTHTPGSYLVCAVGTRSPGAYLSHHMTSPAPAAPALLCARTKVFNNCKILMHGFAQL